MMKSNVGRYEIKEQVIKSISSTINFKVFLILGDKNWINPDRLLIIVS